MPSRKHRLGQAARLCRLLGAEGVAFVALGSGISKGGAVTAGLRLRAGTSVNGATEQGARQRQTGQLSVVSQPHSGVRGQVPAQAHPLAGSLCAWRQDGLMVTNQATGH